MKAPALIQKLKDPEAKSRIKKMILGASALAVIAVAGAAGFKASSTRAPEEGDRHASAQARVDGEDGQENSEQKTSMHRAEDSHAAKEHGPKEHGQEAHRADSLSRSRESQARLASKEPQGLVEKTWAATVKAYEDLQAHADSLRRADEENEKLRLENSHLRLVLERALYDNKVQRAEIENSKNAARNRGATGTEDGRTEHTIGYQPPEHLTPDQLYTLGLTYFRAREDEKAAKIMTVLLRSAEDEVVTGAQRSENFRTGENYLVGAIAWYRIDNLKMASEFLAKAKEVGKAPAVQDQVHLWEALIAEKKGNHRTAQEDLRLVLDRNPHSLEASWINPGGKARSTAPRALAKHNSKKKSQEGSRGIASEHP